MPTRDTRHPQTESEKMEKNTPCKRSQKANKSSYPVFTQVKTDFKISNQNRSEETKVTIYLYRKQYNRKT